MADQGDSHTRRTCFFTGRVQGVGFRYTTVDVASRFKVRGIVRNLSDGRVELVAEGGKAELDRFETALKETMRSNISRVTANDSAATGEFDSFGIAY